MSEPYLTPLPTPKPIPEGEKHELKHIMSVPLKRGHKLWQFTKVDAVLKWIDLKDLPRNPVNKRIVLEVVQGAKYCTAASRKSAMRVFQKSGHTIFHNGNSPTFTR
jgi:hypothetical protein